MYALSASQSDFEESGAKYAYHVHSDVGECHDVVVMSKAVASDGIRHEIGEAK